MRKFIVFTALLLGLSLPARAQDVILPQSTAAAIQVRGAIITGGLWTNTGALPTDFTFQLVKPAATGVLPAASSWTPTTWGTGTHDSSVTAVGNNTWTTELTATDTDTRGHNELCIRVNSQTVLNCMDILVVCTSCYAGNVLTGPALVTDIVSAGPITTAAGAVSSVVTVATTTNVTQIGGTVQTGGDLYPGIVSALARLPAALSANGLMQSDGIRIGGTVQTGRDLGVSVLLSNGTGTGQLKLSGGYISPNFADFNSTLGASAFAASAITAFQTGLYSLPKGVAITGYQIFAHQTGGAVNAGVTGATPTCTAAVNTGAGFGAFSGTGISFGAEVGNGTYAMNFTTAVIGNRTALRCTFAGGSAPADTYQQYIFGQF